MNAESQDAARYRWLRENAYIELHCDSPRADGWQPSMLDAAVDAEMAKPKGAVTTEMVHALRNKTGESAKACLLALREHNGDATKAQEWLRVGKASLTSYRIAGQEKKE